MARPKADAERVNRAVEAVRNGTPLAAAAAAAGIGLSTLKRSLAAVRGGTAHPATAPAATPAAPSPAKPTKAAPVAAAAPASAPASHVAPGGIDAAIQVALGELGDDPEAQIVGAMLRELGSKIAGLDAAKLPAAANAVKTLAVTMRDMRPPRPPSPDQIDERLRELDRPVLEEIERYTAAADKALAARLAALKAWGAEHLTPDLADEHAAMVDGLSAPPEPASPIATGTA